MVPSRPSCTILRASMRCGVLRRCVPTCTTRLYFRAAANIAWPSTISTLMGFCTYTSTPRLHRLDHRQRVPVIGRRDLHHVQIFLPEHLAVVGEQPRLLLRRLPFHRPPRRFFQVLLIDIAERDDLDRRNLHQAEQVRLAVPSAADQTDAFRSIVMLPPGNILGWRDRQYRLEEIGDVPFVVDSGWNHPTP